MDLKALRCFVAVADAGTVTAAATSLSLGQPAVSRQLQQLERELRIELFGREDGRLRLTAAGHEVLPMAREAVRRADAVTRTAAELAAGRLAEVRVVSTSTTRDDVLAPWVATWSLEAPLPSLDEAPVDDVYARLRAGADLAISPVAPDPSLAARLVAYLPLWAYVAPTHPWAERAHVPVHELARQPLLLLGRDFHARRLLDRAFDIAGLGVEPLAQFRSPIAAQAVAASGRGVCVVTDDPRFDLVPLAVHDAAGQRLQVRLHAAWDPRHHAAEALERLADELAAFVRTRYAA